MKKNSLVVNKRLFCSTDNWDIGKGVIVNLKIISKPLALFLRVKYLEDNTCLIGNIERLFALTDEDFEKMDESEMWEA